MPKRRTREKIAFVHDWLTGMRGGEKVLDALCERFPDAELFTLVHARVRWSPTIERLRTHTSFHPRLPLVSNTTATTSAVPYSNRAVLVR